MRVRIQVAEIWHIRNVAHGEILFPCNLKENIFALSSDVIGIYGQNGSGKTTFIRALEILKTLLSGLPIGQTVKDDISIGSESIKMKFEFSVENDCDRKYRAVYAVEIGKDYLNESVKAAVLGEDRKFTRLKQVLSSDSSNTKQVVLPSDKRTEIFGKDSQDLDELRVAKMLCAKEHRSFLFSDEVHKLMKKRSSDTVWNEIFTALHNFGVDGLFVINNRSSGLISVEAGLPFNFRTDTALGAFALPMDRPVVLPQKEFDVMKQVIDTINVVLREIIPGMELSFTVFGKELLENGKQGVRIQLVRLRKQDGVIISTKIPLRCESEGIKKIISFLHLFIVTYNSPDVTLAIDELDSGIFEHLLGELLRIMQDSGKGQLIFTSHNLRPLEVLERNSIVFTTTDRENCYTRRTNLKPSNNLRHCYYRDITLGSDEEELYEETSSIEIAHAMRRVGSVARRTAEGM